MNDSARAGVVGKARGRGRESAGGGVVRKARERATLPATVACSAAASISMHELRRHGRGYGRTGAKRYAATSPRRSRSAHDRCNRRATAVA